MPRFNAAAVARIQAAVKKTERADFGRGPGRGFPAGDLLWLQLTENLTANEADAHPGDWSPSAEAYTAAAARTYTVFDPHGNAEAVIGSWVLCRSIGGTARPLWEIVSVANEDIWGILDDSLVYTGDTATVSIYDEDWTTDTGVNLAGVLPPPTMASGTIAVSSKVRLKRRRDGAWYVDLAPC